MPRLEIAERFYAALIDEDVDGLLALCAEDVEVSYPAAGLLPYGGVWRGRDGVAAFLAAHDEAEEILVFERGQMLADADLVLVIGHFEGRARPSGREWSTAFVHALTFSDRGLHRWEAFFDTAAAVSVR